MTTRGDFSTTQWEALLEAAPAIALAVAAAAGSDRQSESELGAFISLVGRTNAEASPDSLLGKLVADLEGRLASGWRPAADEPYIDGLEAARRAGAILGVSADEAQASEVRSWLLSVARTVAEAAREGGVLGLGGEQVSPHETDTIEAIADALGGEPDRG